MATGWAMQARRKRQGRQHGTVVVGAGMDTQMALAMTQRHFNRLHGPRPGVGAPPQSIRHHLQLGVGRLTFGLHLSLVMNSRKPAGGQPALHLLSAGGARQTHGKGQQHPGVVRHRLIDGLPNAVGVVLLHALPGVAVNQRGSSGKQQL